MIKLSTKYLHGGITQWHTRLLMSASAVALAQMLAPLHAYPRVMTSTLSTLKSAFPAVLVQTLAPLVHLLRNNLFSKHFARLAVA